MRAAAVEAAASSKAERRCCMLLYVQEEDHMVDCCSRDASLAELTWEQANGPGEHPKWSVEAWLVYLVYRRPCQTLIQEGRRRRRRRGAAAAAAARLLRQIRCC